MEKFCIRHSGENAFIELCGDHRAEGYPYVSMLLAEALNAVSQPHPVFSAETMIATDRYFSYWSYKNGIYEIDDDTWGYFITVQDGGPTVVADLEHALTSSGNFVRKD
jgi:hypothetical protein